MHDVRGLISAANIERHEHAEVFGQTFLARARAAGVDASVEVVHEAFSNVTKRFVRLARVADVTILQPSDETLSLMQGLVEEVLFQSGRPVIIVPAAWNKAAGLESIIVLWDGSAKAARAIGDALPLLQQAGRVDIVSITGDPDSTMCIEGAEVAAYLARYCDGVSITTLTSQGGDIGATLSSYVKNTHASMIVMGAYAHNRLRQFVLGGVTSTIISDPPVPVLLSY